MAHKHLILLVHGLFGNGNHMKSNSDQLKEQFSGDDSVVVHIAKSNESLKTFDGIDVGAERIFVELMDCIKELIAEGHSVKYFSIVGYSLGGLFARYLVGMLESVGFFNSVAPVVFATFATPHAGTYFHSKRWKARLLNACGSRLLGLTGGDLFNCNETLEELADLDSRYIAGLRRFKKRILFANAVRDRTVPFWTSYLTTRNPFRHLEKLHLKYYNHSAVVKYKHVRPFLINMVESSYSAEYSHPMQLTRQDKFLRVLFLVLLPVFFPAMIAVLSTGTIVARIKSLYYLFRPRPQKTAQLFDSVLKQLSYHNESQHHHDEHHHHNLEAGALTEGALENMLELVEPQEGEEEEKEMSVGGTPEPAVNGGFAGLIESTPYELGISPRVKKILDNLNTLEWEKYAVGLAHFNTHGEIVNRRRSDGQGLVLQKFFAHIVAKTYNGLVKEAKTVNEAKPIKEAKTVNEAKPVKEAKTVTEANPVKEAKPVPNL